MTKKEQAELEAENKAEEAEAEDAKDDETPSGEESEEELSKPVDYDAILEAEKKRAKDAEDALELTRVKAKERIQKKKDEEEYSEEEEDKPLTAKDLHSFESRIVARTRAEMQEGRALEIARAHTSSESEAQAAVLYFKNRVQPTGNLEDDVLFAIGGLNSRKLLAEKSELVRALRGKDMANGDSSGNYHDSPKVMPKGAPDVVASLKRMGYKQDTKGAWTKKLPSGRILIANPKNGRTKLLK